MATATQATPQPRKTPSGFDRTDALILAAVALALGLFLLPILLVAAVLSVAARLAHAPRWVLPAAAFLVCAAWAVWQWHSGVDPRRALALLARGYATTQQDALMAGIRLHRAGGGLAAYPWHDYLRATLPAALLAGSLLGSVVAAYGLRRRGSYNEAATSPLPIEDAGVLATRPEAPIPWVVPEVIGSGVVSLVSGPPGIGKGYWTWGLLRAIQRHDTFYGLPVHLPRRRVGWLWWRRWRPARVLWLSEEGASFGRTAKQFGIAPGLIDVLRRDQLRLTDWPAIVALVRREAWRRRCGLVLVDTIRAWCPQAETTNEQASFVLNLARRELAEPGLAVVFLHHDRKTGGDYGAGVAGASNLVGSVDVLVELKRVPDRADARRMLVSRRFGDRDLTARLIDGRYVADGALAKAPTPPVGQAAYAAYLQSPEWLQRRDAALARVDGRCEACHTAPAAEVHHQTYERLGSEAPDDLQALCAACHREAHASAPLLLPPQVRRVQRLLQEQGTLTLEALCAAEGVTRSPMQVRLKALEAAELVTVEGTGKRGDPKRWRLR